MALGRGEEPNGELLVEDEEVIARVATYYYHDDLNQGQIADRLGLSRIKVSRLLEKGRQNGLIQVTINSPFEGCAALQDQLIGRFALRDARIIPALPEADVNARVARAAAQHLFGHLSEGDLLAVGWGDTVARTLRLMARTLVARSVDIVGLTGGVAAYLDALRFRDHRLGVHLIPTPLRVSSPDFAQALRREPFVRDVLAMATTASTALVGVGALSGEPSLLRNGYCTRQELDLFRRSGAVGDILGYFYDASGRVLSLDLHDHVVAVDLGTLARIDTVIAAAAGADKVAAIRAALTGRHADVLVTDEPTAAAILEE